MDLFRLIWHFPRLLRLFSRLFRDQRVGALPKALLVGALLYVLSPFDFLSDMLPVIGVMDDLALVLVAARTFIGLCPPAVVDEHLLALDPTPARRG